MKKRSITGKRPKLSVPKSYAELQAGADADPDNLALSEKQLRSLKRVPAVKRLRWRLGLSQGEFAEQFEIPIGTLRDWEQGRSEPDQAAQAYLKVIAAKPDLVGRALKASA